MSFVSAALAYTRTMFNAPKIKIDRSTASQPHVLVSPASNAILRLEYPSKTPWMVGSLQVDNAYDHYARLVLSHRYHNMDAIEFEDRHLCYDDLDDVSFLRRDFYVCRAEPTSTWHYDYMREALRAKFGADEEARAALVATGNLPISYQSAGELHSYWTTARGPMYSEYIEHRNMVGRLMEEIRAEITITPQ